jgi:hypothetical protein
MAECAINYANGMGQERSQVRIFNTEETRASQRATEKDVWALRAKRLEPTARRASNSTTPRTASVTLSGAHSSPVLKSGRHTATADADRVQTA